MLNGFENLVSSEVCKTKLTDKCHGLRFENLVSSEVCKTKKGLQELPLLFENLVSSEVCKTFDEWQLTHISLRTL